MSAEVIRLSTCKPRVTKVEKVRTIPNLFKNLLEKYKQRQDEIRRKKINFLTNEAYQYFYEILYHQIEFKKYEVDIPYFLKIEQCKKDAHEQASKAMLEVIEQKRVDECYKKRVAELKKAQRAVSKKHRG